jgi:hypothetical protein
MDEIVNDPLSENSFDKELALVQMWVDEEVEFEDLPEDVRDALTEVFSDKDFNEPEPIDVPPVVDLVKSDAVQHLDLLHKANDEHRFTLGPWYIPDRYDAHGEWTDASELQKALWDYVKGGDRDIRLQHNKDIVAGEWLEAMSFPVPVTIGMKKASSEEQVVYPAGTVFLGVQWKPWAWDMVKAGKIRGFSIGGAAARIDMRMPDDVSKASFGSRSEAGRYAANVRWRGHITRATMGAMQTAGAIQANAEKKQKNKGQKKPNIAERIKAYFTTLPEPYRSAEDRAAWKRRRANENFVDSKSVEVISLPNGRSVMLNDGKITTTKFPSEGVKVSRDRPLKMPKATTAPTGRKQKEWLGSGWGTKPVVRNSFSKDTDALKHQVRMNIRVAYALQKENPTSSAVHVDSVMGSKGKKKKRVKPSLEDVELITKADSPAWQREAGKNPKGGLNAKGRASYKRETGGTLKPPVKRGDNPRRASFLARMGNMAGPERDENGDPTRLLLSLQAWGASSKEDARKKAVAISARNKVAKVSFGGDRSEAGRYAANQRWQGRGHVASKYVKQWHRENGRGTIRYPQTPEGKALGRSMPSLQTHCDLDALAQDFNKFSKNIDSIDSPSLVYKHLSEERRAVWDAILRPTLEGIPQGTNPNGSRVFVKAGGGGAGKSSTPDIEGVSIPTTGEKDANKQPTPRNAVLSNADDIKEMLPEWKQAETASDAKMIKSPKGKTIASGALVDRRAAMVHEESSLIASFQVTAAIRAGKDVVVDGTMDNGIDKSLGKLGSYRDGGASEVHMIAYTCDTDEAEARAYKRSLETGRKVPTESLRKAHTKVSANFPTYIEKGGLDSVTVIDTNRNDDGSKRDATKIFEYKPSGGIKILNQALYQRFLDKRNDSLKSGINTVEIDEQLEEES